MTVARRLSKVFALVGKAVVYEIRLWRSLIRWILRRPFVPGDNAKAFGYASVVTPLFLAFIGVSAIELPILHMLLPWEGVRLLADAVSVYSLFWMLGLLAMLRVHPHVVNDAGLRIRNGPGVDIAIPWEAVATIRSRHRTLDSRRAVQFDRTESGPTVHIVILSQTNVDVVLRHPTVVRLPKGSGEPITELRLYADDPGALVARAREHLSDSPDTRSGPAELTRREAG